MGDGGLSRVPFAPLGRPRLVDYVGWLRGRCAWFRVAGASMHPHLREGDRVLVDRRAYAGGQSPALGDVVLARHPFRSETLMIKRVSCHPGAPHAAARPGEEGVFLLGDNPDESTDSRYFGAVRRDAILGRVQGRLA